MIARCLAAAAALLVGFAAQAQTYPTRAVKMVIAFPPGGAIDVVARTLAQKLGFYLGQNVLVENRPGGNTLIGGEAVARSPMVTACIGSTSLGRRAACEISVSAVTSGAESRFRSR